MKAEKWKVVEQLFDAALAQLPERRAPFLLEACPEDQELREEVLSLLNSDDNAISFLESSPAVLIDRTSQLARGDKLGHFEVLELIGRGGMGVVYKAQDTNLPRFVALKFLPEHLAEDRTMLERFKREAHAASALNHPNICTVYELGEHEGHAFIAMELLEGETLRERMSARLNPGISEGQGARSDLSSGLLFQVGELLDLAIQITEGLEAAHSKGITHRDIKPANLFLTGAGQLKILDFGIAKFQTAERSKLTVETGGAQTLPSSTDEGLTSPGALIGTVAYMSPEQLSGMELDTRTDIFSFGAVLYEMATGVAPFRRETPALIRQAILHEEPLSPARVNPLVPQELDRIIVKALEKNRERRYQHAADLRTDLQRLREVPGRPTVRTPKLLVVCAVLVLAAAGFWLLLSSHAETSAAPATITQRKIATLNPQMDPGDTDGERAVYLNKTAGELIYGDLAGKSRRVILKKKPADFESIGFWPSRDFSMVALKFQVPDKKELFAVVKTDGTGYRELAKLDGEHVCCKLVLGQSLPPAVRSSTKWL